MADMQSPDHPLEILPAMLNLVLLQTSKILRDPECHNPKQAGLTRRRITEMIPPANQRFHDALDEVEVEILQAKAVMERDLCSIRQKRAERDRVNGVTSAPSSPKLQIEAEPKDEAMEVEQGALGPQSNHSPLPGSEPIPTAEQHAVSAAPKSPIEPLEPKSLAVDVTADSDMPQDSGKSLGLAITMPPESAAVSLEETSDPTKKPTGATPPTLETPSNVAEAVDLDFESMFNDTELVTGDDTINFDLGFSTDTAINQDTLNDSTFDDITMGNTDVTDIGGTTSEDINTLLPGLENYVNADTDFTNVGLPSTLPEATPGTVPGYTSDQVPTDHVIEDSAFDDLFASDSFTMDGTRGDELGDGTLGDFNDDWFNTS